jgi:hypothetical protein
MADNYRVLTEAQHERLEKLSVQYPQAEVVGWHNKDSEQRYGPVIRFYPQKVEKFVNYTGRVLNGQ